MSNDKLVAALFSIPGSDPEQTLEYAGWHNPDIRWNGFAVPEFDRATAEKILNDAGIKFNIRRANIRLVDPKDGDELIRRHTRSIDGKEKFTYEVGEGWTWVVSGTTTFDLYIDRNIMVWEREHHSVEAESMEEAVKILTDVLEKEPGYGSSELPSYNQICETLHETSEFMDPEENGGFSTLEIVNPENKDTHLWSNGIPQT